MLFGRFHSFRSFPDDGHPLAPVADECPPCHTTKINWKNQRKCVRLPYCCRGKFSLSSKRVLEPCYSFIYFCLIIYLLFFSNCFIICFHFAQFRPGPLRAVPSQSLRKLSSDLPTSSLLRPIQLRRSGMLAGFLRCRL